MAPPVEGGGGYANGGGGGARPNAIRIGAGVPIGAQACSPPKPFKQPSAMSVGNGVVPQMSRVSLSSLASSAANGSQVLLFLNTYVCVPAQMLARLSDTAYIYV